MLAVGLPILAELLVEGALLAPLLGGERRRRDCKGGKVADGEGRPGADHVGREPPHRHGQRGKHRVETDAEQEQAQRISLCETAGVEIRYENADTDFKIEFSRIDRNKLPLSGQARGRISDHISNLEQAVLSCLRDDPGMANAKLIVKTGKSQRTITRAPASLKGKELITRIGSNKAGYWQVK